MRLEDIQFELTERGKFSIQKNADKLFSYLTERVNEEGVVNLSDVAGELAKRYGAYRNTIGTNLNNAAELVSQKYGLRTITIVDSIAKCYPDVDEIKGLKRCGRCRDTKLLFKEDDALLDYVRNRTTKRNVVVVELNEDESKLK